MQNEVLVLNKLPARLDRLGRDPDMALRPLQSELEVLPIAKLLNIASDAKVLPKLSFIMDTQRQIEVFIIINRILRRLALLVLRT